jgi:hypothetical protein
MENETGQSTAPKRFSGKRLWNWARLLIGILGLGAVVYAVADSDALIKTLLDIDLAPVLLAFLLIMVSTMIKTWRWRLLLKLSHVEIRFRRLFGTYLVGTFYSQFMPGSAMGGDAMRMVEMSADSGQAASSVSSVLVERAIGLLTIMTTASLILVFSPHDNIPNTIIYIIYALTIVMLTGLAVLRLGWFVKPAVRLLDRIRLGIIGNKIQKLSNEFQGHLGHPKVLGQMVVLSFLANACTMTASYLILLAFGDSVYYLDFIPLIALSVAIEVIPISPGALGLREAAYVTFLGFLNVPEAVALGTALVLRAVTMAQAGIGGIVLITRAFSPAPIIKPEETVAPVSATSTILENK